MILYDYFRSTAAYRVRMALNLKGIAYTSREIHLVKGGGEQYLPDYVALNPESRVPALVDNGVVITQSLAIIEYLESRYPVVPLLPADPVAAAKVRALSLLVAADIHPLNNLSVLNYLKQELQVSEQEKLAWYHHWVQRGFTALEVQLRDQANVASFCVGQSASMADICVVAQVYNAQRFSVDMTAYPYINRINAHMLSLAPVAKAVPTASV